MVVYGNVSVYCLVWTKNIIFIYYIFYIKTIPSLLLLLTPQSKYITQKPSDKHYRSKVHFKVHLRSDTLLSPSEDHRRSAVVVVVMVRLFGRKWWRGFKGGNKSRHVKSSIHFFFFCIHSRNIASIFLQPVAKCYIALHS